MNQDNLGGIKERIILHRLLGTSIAVFAVFLFTFAIVPNLVLEASATTNLNASVLWGGISLELDPDYVATQAGGSTSDAGHGDINFGTITPTSNNGDNKGTMRVAKKTIGINTSGKYYAVYISMANPVTGTAVNDLLLDGTNNIPIPAIGDGSTTGTWTNPITFSGSAWGYAVPSSPVSNGFDSSSAYSAYPISSSAGNATADLTHTNNSTIYNTTKWAAIPVVADTSLAQMIWKAETANTKGFGVYENDSGATVTGDTENNHFDIYFATMVDTDTLAGEYSNSIVYTALASARSLDQISTNVKRDKAFGGAGDTVHLEFDLATSASDLSASNLTVAIVKHSVASLINGNLSNTDLTISSNDYAECTSVTNVVFSENGASLDCELPESIDGILGKGDGKGEYDFWIKVNNYNYNYISRYKDGSNNLVASFTYAGLQSTTDTEGEHPLVTQMQEMSGGVCRNTNMWGHLINTTERSDDALIYDYQGDSVTGAVPLANTSADSVAIGLGTFLLSDNRETLSSGGYKTYLVRRLADGNCWMVQNLDLNLRKFAGTHNLTPDNTDLTASREYWDPSESALLKAQAIDATVTQSNYFTTFAQNYLGNAQDIQFQPYLVFGTNQETGITYYWGTRCTGTEPGTCSNENDLQNTILSQIPRSYNVDSENASFQPETIYYLEGTSYYQYARDNIGVSNNLAYGDPYINHTISSWSPETKNSNDNTIMLGTRYYGDYYNWYAATAESGTLNMSTSEYHTGATANDSICPKGWKLPASSTLGETEGSWTTLINDTYKYKTEIDGEIVEQTITTSDTTAAKGAALLPLSLSQTGSYGTNSSLRQRGVHSYLWSAVTNNASSSTITFYMFNTVNSINPSNYSAKIAGYAIRCVARD